MTDFITRESLHYAAHCLSKSKFGILTCSGLHELADKAPDPVPTEVIILNSANICCGHCGSISGLVSMNDEHNKFCGNCGWPIDWGD